MSKERLDKIIASSGLSSRSEVKVLIKKGLVKVNGSVVLDASIKVDCDSDDIVVDGKSLKKGKFVYIMLNKPKGVVSATNDNKDLTVVDILPDELKRKNLFPAGRLDKDTTGFCLITDDGDFAHNILSPRKHVKKEYEVTLDIPVTEIMVKGFKECVKLNDGECKSAILKITGEYTAKVTIVEGRYHQIKRMFGCYGAKVVELNRVCMGNLYLPKELKLGEIKELTQAELKQIQ